MKNQLIWRGIKGPNGHRLHMHANHKYNQTRLDYLVLKSPIKSIPRIRFWSNSALNPPEMTCMSSHGWKITKTSHLNQTDDCPVTFKFLFRKGCCFFFPQLGQLLRQAAERGDQGFDPSTALFVCNWWDQVNPRDQDHVLQETLRRLSRVLPGVGRQQVFPLSSTEVCHCYQHISQACLVTVKM